MRYEPNLLSAGQGGHDERRERNSGLAPVQEAIDRVKARGQAFEHHPFPVLMFHPAPKLGKGIMN